MDVAQLLEIQFPLLYPWSSDTLTISPVGPSKEQFKLLFLDQPILI